MLMPLFSNAQEKSAADFKNEGNEALRSKDLQKALECYEQAITLWGDEAEMATVYNAADCARKLKKNERAIELFTMCENNGTYKPDYCAYYIAKAMEDIEGKEAERQTKLEASKEKYTEGKAVAFIKKDLAKIYLNEGKSHYDKASEILKECEKAKPEQYAEIQGRAKEEFKLALPLFEKAAATDETNKNAPAFINATKDQLK